MFNHLFTNSGTSNSQPSPRPLFEAIAQRNDDLGNAVRHLIEDWLSRFPLQGRRGLTARLRADDNAFWGAFLELLLHEVFTAAGATVEVEPTVGGRKTPDFRLSLGGEAFLLEATVLMESDKDQRAERRHTPILEALGRVRSTDFLVHVDRIVEGTDQPSGKRLAHQLDRWLQTLDWQSVRDTYRVGGYSSSPTAELNDRDWSIVVNVTARHPGKRGTEHGGPTPPSRVRWVNDYQFIADDLKEKARLYRSVGEPLALAVANTRWTASAEEMYLALYGVAWEQPAMMRRKQINPTWTDTPEGLWITRSGPRYADVPVVLSVNELAPWKIGGTSITVWHNPSQPHELAGLPFGHVAPDPQTGSLLHTPAAKPLWELLGLPRDWPQHTP